MSCTRKKYLLPTHLRIQNMLQVTAIKTVQFLRGSQRLQICQLHMHTFVHVFGENKLIRPFPSLILNTKTSSHQTTAVSTPRFLKYSIKCQEYCLKQTTTDNILKFLAVSGRFLHNYAPTYLFTQQYFSVCRLVRLELEGSPLHILRSTCLA